MRDVDITYKVTRQHARPISERVRWSSEPDKDAVLKRGGEVVVARQRCVEWSWTEDIETHAICVTPDGVLLRLVVGGETVMEARSVRYRPQPPELFRVPTNYAPALGR